MSLVCLTVCVTCNHSQTLEEQRAIRAGASLHEQVREAWPRHPGLEGAVLRPVQCMSACKRPCTAAMSGAECFTLLIGDLQPSRATPDLLITFARYLQKQDDFLRRDERPPALLAGSLTRTERFKLPVLHCPTIRSLDVLLPSVDTTTQAILAHYGVTSGEFVLVAPGGSAAHRSLPQAAEVVAGAVGDFAARVPAVIGLGEAPSMSMPVNVRLAARVPMAELVALASIAKVVLTNGADALLQVIALARPCVAIALSPDQTVRLKRLTDAGVPVEILLDSSAIAAAVAKLYCDADAAAANVEKLRTLTLNDGLAAAISAIERLLKKETMSKEIAQ